MARAVSRCPAAPWQGGLVRAIERGEIAVETDVELALDLLFGSLYHRLLHRHAPLNAAVAGRAVDAVLDGVVGTPGSA